MIEWFYLWTLHNNKQDHVENDNGWCINQLLLWSIHDIYDVNQYQHSMAENEEDKWNYPTIIDKFIHWYFWNGDIKLYENKEIKKQNAMNNMQSSHQSE